MACGANRRSGETLAAPIGEAGRIRSANMKLSRNFFYVRCCASPIGRVRIIAPIISAQHKENERIGEAWLTIRALPIVIEIA